MKPLVYVFHDLVVGLEYFIFGLVVLLYCN